MTRFRWGGFAGAAFPLATLVLAAAPAAGGESLLFSPRFVLSDSTSLPAPAADSAALYLIREQFVRTMPLPPERVLLDGLPATLLPQRTWCALMVAPGRHRISGILGCPDFTLDCRAGRTYVLRMREVIDANDQWSARLLLDSFTAGRLAIERERLKHVTTTSAGMTILARAAARSGRDADSGAARAAPADTLVEILIERPLDQVNLQNDFFHMRGRLVVDSAGLHYRMSGRIATSLTRWRSVADSEEVAFGSIRSVRFGGVRFTGASPWVNIVYLGASGLRTISFASYHEEDAVETYNRLFADILERFAPLDGPRTGLASVRAASLP